MRMIEFEDVHRAYRRGEEVLRGVTFGVGPGEVVGLLGKNGAGKTTLMRIAMGMLEPQRGSVQLFGLNPRQDAVGVKRRVGYVSEDQILPPFLRVAEALDLHRELFPTWDEAMAGELLECFQLPAGDKIGSLSKGQARQVALVCAVAHKPDLLLLDEPAGGLDPIARREFLETSIQFVNQTGSSILFSSHYMADVERVAGRVVMLHGGKVLIDSDLDDLRENHSVALVPYSEKASRTTVLGLEGCLGVRDRVDALHAVFHLPPDASERMLATRLGIKGARCRSVALEEMFVELVGGQP